MYAELSSLFGVPLHPTMKKKIWKGEYIDYFSLLFREPEPKVWPGGGAVAQELEQYQCPKLETKWMAELGVRQYHLYGGTSASPGLESFNQRSYSRVPFGAQHGFVTMRCSV